MIGTATSKLFAFSRAACPPRLNRPTLYPVLPRFRVGIADCVFGLTGTSDIAWPTDARAGIAACVSRPAATAPPVFKKLRRFAELGGLFIDKSLESCVIETIVPSLSFTRHRCGAVPFAGAAAEASGVVAGTVGIAAGTASGTRGDAT